MSTAEIEELPLFWPIRTDLLRSNRPCSIGMGPYIAREVAKSRNGQIAVTSAVAEGTWFTIRLPRVAAPTVGQSVLDAEHVLTR